MRVTGVFEWEGAFTNADIGGACQRLAAVNQSLHFAVPKKGKRRWAADFSTLSLLEEKIKRCAIWVFTGNSVDYRLKVHRNFHAELFSCIAFLLIFMKTHYNQQDWWRLMLSLDMPVHEYSSTVIQLVIGTSENNELGRT